ncbi:Formyltransferase [Daldinia eschscholtzii]|nr:Formyltransferase [Daldinia eschscholtzii]
MVIRSINMRALLRQVAAVPFGSRSWHELSRTQRVDARLFQSAITATSRPAMRRPVQLSRICNACRQMRRYSSTTTSPVEEGRKTKAESSDPLNILFCGSDEFSCAALEALEEERLRNPKLIQSISVVARPTKNTGRGNKKPTSPPIRGLVTRLQLPVYLRDTFTGWDMPPNINLIIAVSFGLFVPPRLLRAAKYGGLNLHPSFLPDLRGPAPLQHALLAGRTHTGVSLQTLDEKAFDHGLVLARTRPIPIPPDVNFADLLRSVSPLAAELLVKGLRDGVHVPPLEEAREHSNALKISLGASKDLLHAPKITTQDRQLRFDNIAELSRRYRALGPLWFWARNNKGERKRVIVHQIGGEDPGLVKQNIPYTLNLDAGDPVSRSGLSLDYKQWKNVYYTAETFANESEIGACGPRLLAIEDDDKAPAILYDTGVNSDGSGSSTYGEKKKYLVLWVSGDDKGVIYIGPHRIEKLKVEGEIPKPARKALKGFLISLEHVGDS